MTKQNIIIVVVILALLLVGGLAFVLLNPAPTLAPQNQTNNIQNQNVQNATKDDLIWVALPLPNQVVTSPLTVTGRARGNWFFEASFPVTLKDANGNILAQAPAQAQGDWMTTEYVNFSVVLTFVAPATPTGTLILEKDNPSGLPQNANELQIPVTF